MNSKLILGTAQFGLNYGINNNVGNISAEDCNSILSRALKSGVDTLDTAEVYGNAHQLIGKFHKRNDNSKFKIITKLPIIYKKNSIVNKVVDYLDILNVKNLEILMFHSFESFCNNSNSIDSILNLKSKGLIKNIGVSIYTNKELELLLDMDLIDAIQLPFNLLDNFSVRGELIKKLKQRGKIIHSRSSFLQGLFFKNTDDKNLIVQQLKKSLLELNQITNDLECSMEELALSYCVSQKEIDKVIVGVESLSQLRSNLKASNFKIGKSVKEKINNINIKNLNLLNPSLWNQVLS